ncbi:hypothetical protein DSO57_1013258 [Entomophthora muscae]|uniref:Uncharacterized protein n=1 Tax=Entomophthora muscae TaxID=34485 RepID=A0ACC2T5X7_9FUNG|nr:hypothetical protein DSO57_1013258 [Entomophthora muscae]
MLVASDPTVLVVFCGFPVVCLCRASEHDKHVYPSLFLPCGRRGTSASPAAITIPPGSQVVIDSQISYELPEKSFLELYSPETLSCTKPLLCPGF